MNKINLPFDIAMRYPQSPPMIPSPDVLSDPVPDDWEEDTPNEIKKETTPDDDEEDIVLLKLTLAFAVIMLIISLSIILMLR